MPDLVTHTAIAYFAVRHSVFKRFRIVFYLGTILPDISSRPFYIIQPALYPYTVAIHTPVFSVVSCLVLAELFSTDIRRYVRAYLIAGVALHYILDLIQKHLGEGYYLLFPFSWTSNKIGMLWPEEILLFVPVWLILIAVSELLLYSRKKT
jgi:hypothetical protein